MVQSVKPKQRRKTILSLFYLRFSEADVGLMLLEENGLVAQGAAIISRGFQVRPHRCSVRLIMRLVMMILFYEAPRVAGINIGLVRLPPRYVCIYKRAQRAPS